MKTAIGFVNLHGSPSLGKLTQNRPLGSVTFLGRYGLIDFPLSNFTNSGINKIEILVERHLDSIRSHTQNGSTWISNTRTGFLRSVINEDGLFNSSDNTDIANIVHSVPPDVITEDYIIISPAHFLTALDFQVVMKAATQANAGITVVYTHTDKPKDYFGCNKIVIDSDACIRKFAEVDGAESDANVSLDTYVMTREVFFGMLNFAKEISNTRTTIQRMVEIFAKNKMTKVYAYQHKGFVQPILSLNQYCNASFSMLEHATRSKLFFEDKWPIYTTTHNTPPVLYGENAHVSNSVVSNGCKVFGSVRNCILSRDVIIEEGAVVENCILFFGTKVGKDVKIDHVVTDKKVEIKNVKKLSGDDPDFLLISKGASI